MKRKIWITFLIGLLACLMSVFFVGCNEKDNVKNGLSFNTLTVEGNTVYGTVANDVETYSFINEIKVEGKTKFTVSLDVYGTEIVATKTIPLEVGDNIVYITELIDDEPANVFTVKIRRRPMYVITFNTNGGTSVEPQVIEEGNFAIEPTTTRIGYTFTGWGCDFTQPITASMEMTASWTANNDTRYTVNYYLQNLDDNDYALQETVEFKGTTDTTATAEIKDYAHFTYKASKSTISGNIDGNGNRVLSVYYTRNAYEVSINNVSHGDIINDGIYKYGEKITVVVSSYLGYEFVGWYSGEELLSTDATYTFTVDKTVTAKFAVKAEMSNFNFTSTATACSITGLKDKTVTEIVVPDYVTSISKGAFSGCSWLKSITIPFIGGNKFATTASASTLFGYVFGVSSYAEGVPTKQYYEQYSYETYYIPASLRTVRIVGGNIFYGAFYNCDSLTSVVIEDSVKLIGGITFYNCSNLVNVVLPDSVTSIGDSAFYNCSSLTNVYYKGATEEWSNMSIGSYNSKLTNASRYYYSETQPTTTGKYWHYNENGEILVWE